MLYSFRVRGIQLEQPLLVLLFQLVDGSRLDVSGRSECEILTHSALVLDKSHHVLLNEGHAKNINHLWTFFIVFN